MKTRTFHGHAANSGSPEYRVWCGMIYRCENKRSKSYHNYGGRGIKICERWRSDFNNFLEDMGPRPSLAHSIERLDSNKDYEPGNCKWATPMEQGNNTRRNKIVEVDGERMTLAQAAHRRGLHYPTVKSRLLRGMALEKALSHAHLKLKLNEAAAREIVSSNETAKALSRKYGVTPNAIRAVRKGAVWSHVTGVRKAVSL